MNAGFVRTSLITAIIALVSGCAILQRDAPEKKARAFMMSFQESLVKNDRDVLQHFKSNQSNESLLAAINLLQNEDSELVECVADFNNMRLDVEEVDESIKEFFNLINHVVKVTVPVVVRAKQGDDYREVELVFWLREKSNNFAIYKLEAENFYATFKSLNHDILYAQHQEEELKSREAIYAFADTLAEEYDRVIWYANYAGHIYYYVINGDWNEEYLYSRDAVRPDFKMGLVNSAGKEILPVAFDMIGTIGAEIEDVVEVKSSEGYGYFSLDGDTLVPPIYDQIIAWEDFWIVQSEGEFGWIDKSKKYKSGFPNKDVEHSVREFNYLPSGVTIKEDTYSLCEIPSRDGAGSGVFITPSSWVIAGLMEPFKSGITTTVTDVPIGGWTQYIELSETVFQSISENFGVLIATFRERYLEGREEFYDHKTVLFKDSLQNTLLVQEYSGDHIEMKKVSDDILEVATHHGYGEEDEYFEGMPLEGELQGLNIFRYYIIDEINSVEELSSHRSHAETEFAKMDDSYIIGDFRQYGGEDTGWQILSVYPASYLQRMRNEILADYGVQFTNEEDQDYFNQFKWYNPRFNSEAEIQDLLTDVDKHNLAFLAKAIQKAQDKVSI